MNFQPLQLTVRPPKLYDTFETIKEEILDPSGETIGKITIYIVDADESTKGFVDQYRGNSHSNWAPMEVFQAIEFDYDHCPVFGKVVIFDRLEINEDLRGNGIGTAIIHEVINHFAYKSDYMLMKPSPFNVYEKGIFKEVDDFETKRQRLENFYASRFNFQRVPTQNEYRCPIIYRKMKP